MTQAESPMTEATERSISPPMMTSAMVSATMLFSIESWNRLTKFPTLRKYGDPTLLNATIATKSASIIVSQPLSLSSTLMAAMRLP